MFELWLASAAIIGGFVGLVWSADRFVEGSAAIAHSRGVSPLVVGLTIVALGTSAPEIVVSISASVRDTGDLAIGNAIGSNLANIGLVLGATALIATLPVQRHILRHELPMLLAVTLLGGVLLYDNHLARWEGVLLLIALAPALAYLAWAKKRSMTQPEIEEELSRIVPLPMRTALTRFAFGLTLLIVSSEILVWGARVTALALGVSPLVIGLTLIALGTSLPELATAIASARRGLHDIALGNIIGSNIFNLLAVMAIPGIFDSPTVEAGAFGRDYISMSLLTMLLAAGIYLNFRPRRIASVPAAAKGNHQRGLGRTMGILLLTAYAGYYVLLFNTF